MEKAFALPAIPLPSQRAVSRQAQKERKSYQSESIIHAVGRLATLRRKETS